jgi:thioredoxin reductase
MTMTCEQETTGLEYLIIGGGPAGLQLGYFLKHTKSRYLILEADAPGHFFSRFPRHRRLISNNKIHTGFDDPNLNLRWDWNSLISDDPKLLFKYYSKDYFPPAPTMVRYLRDFAARHELNIKTGTRVMRVSRSGTQFEVIDQNDNRFTANVLIIATGMFNAYVPPIAGIEAAEHYTDVSVNPEEFEDQRVLIIGKGNSAFETADNLIGTASLIHLVSRSPLSMAWKTHYVGHLRAINNSFLDTYLLKSQNALIDANIEKIDRRNGKLLVTLSYAHADSETEELCYDRVILCTGFRFDDSIFDPSCRPTSTLDGRLPGQTSEWESINIRDLYFAGTLMQVRDYKKKQSGFIHGFRYNIKMLHQILRKKYSASPMPRRTIPSDPGLVAAEIIRRVNTTSALWQQNGFMCDLMVFNRERSEVYYYDELTVDYVRDKWDHEVQYYTVTLEFGQERIDAAQDVFRVERPRRDDAAKAELSTGIHPILRRYCRGQLVSTHHVMEDFLSEWKEEVHVKPLVQFMNGEFAHARASSV